LIIEFVWCLVFVVWCLLFGVWCLVFGVWCLVFGVCCLVLNAQIGTKSNPISHFKNSLTIRQQIKIEKNPGCILQPGFLFIFWVWVEDFNRCKG
jgi:hypothetical protein